MPITYLSKQPSNFEVLVQPTSAPQRFTAADISSDEARAWIKKQLSLHKQMYPSEPISINGTLFNDILLFLVDGTVPASMIAEKDYLASVKLLAERRQQVQNEWNSKAGKDVTVFEHAGFTIRLAIAGMPKTQIFRGTKINEYTCAMDDYNEEERKKYLKWLNKPQTPVPHTIIGNGIEAEAIKLLDEQIRLHPHSNFFTFPLSMSPFGKALTATCERI